MDSRPIKFNKKGKYNLDFIDWNNEWERVGEISAKIENGEEVSDKEEEARIKKHMELDMNKFGVKIEKYKLLSSKEIPLNKECYICLKGFRLNTRVLELPCKHLFDEACLKPWFKSNSTCPICKFDLKQGEKESNKAEEEDWF